jgi:hypothetical protein
MLHLAIPLFTETSRSSSSDAVLRRLATQGNGNVAGVRIREPITTKSLVSAALFRSGVKGLLGQQALTPRGGNHIPHSLSPFQTVNLVSAYALARLVKYVFFTKASLLHKDVFYACSSRAADMPRADGLVQHGQIRQWGIRKIFAATRRERRLSPWIQRGFAARLLRFRKVENGTFARSHDVPAGTHRFRVCPAGDLIRGDISFLAKRAPRGMPWAHRRLRKVNR